MTRNVMQQNNDAILHSSSGSDRLGVYHAASLRGCSGSDFGASIMAS